MWLDSPHRIGRNTISVMNDETMLSPRPSTIEEKFCVSSWTRCAAPSMVRTCGQLAM